MTFEGMKSCSTQSWEFEKVSENCINLFNLFQNSQLTAATLLSFLLTLSVVHTFINKVYVAVQDVQTMGLRYSGTQLIQTPMGHV